MYQSIGNHANGFPDLPVLQELLSLLKTKEDYGLTQDIFTSIRTITRYRYHPVQRPASRHPTIAEWLGEVLHSGDKVGIDGWVNTVAEVESLRISLDSKELQLVSVDDPFNLLWEDRPLYLKAHRLFYLWNTVACLVPIS